jgi:5,10-methylenetetrahydromethanopterin reductase
VNRIGLGLLAQPSLGHIGRVALAAEQSGFDSIFVAETQIRRDAVTMLTAIVVQTSRIRVGSAAINIYTREAALLAVTWATLAEVAPGRMILGLGVGSASTLAQQGIETSHPIGRLREYTEAIRAMWERPDATYQGRYVNLAVTESELRPQPTPPIFYCVGGPQAIALAARQADGIVLDLFLSPKVVAESVRRLHGAAGGHYPGEVGTGIMVSVDADWRRAARRLRPQLVGYITSFHELAREMGLDDEFVARLAAVRATSGIEAASRLIDDELVDELTICGPVERCAERVQRYRDAGATLPVLFPEPQSVMATATSLGPD